MKRKDLVNSNCVTKRQRCVSVYFFFHTAGTAITNSFSGSNRRPLLKLNASTHIEPLQDNKVSTRESLTSFTLSHLPPLRVNTKLPSTPQGLFFFFFFFTSSTNTSIFFSLIIFYFYPPKRTSDMAKNVNFQFMQICCV